MIIRYHEDNVKYPEPGQIYRHYKGGKYVILFLAKHTSTEEPLVIYQSLLFGSYHARPLSEWFENVPSANGEFQRFKLIQE